MTNTTLPANRRFATYKIVVTTQNRTPMRAANTLGALSTIFRGRFNPDTIPLANVATGLYFGLINARIIKSIAKNPIIMADVRAETSNATANDAPATTKTIPATTRTVVLSLCSPEMGHEKLIAIIIPP